MFKLARRSLIGFTLCISACTLPAGAPQNLGSPAPAKAMLYFEGSADPARSTIDLVVHPAPGGVKAEDTLGYGNSTGDVYFHTCGTPSFNSSTHVLSGNVQGVNLTATNIGSFNAIIDNITVTGATITDVGPTGLVSGYLNVAPNTDDCGVATTEVWSFTDVASNTSFNFSGHAEGTPALTGEVGGWLFDERNFITGVMEAPDFTGNGHTGNISSSRVSWLASGCHSDGCLSFPIGSNNISAQAVTPASTLLFGTGNFTVSAWILTSSTAAGDAVVATNSTADSSCTPPSGWLLETDGGLPTFGTFPLKIGPRTAGTGRISGATAVNDGNWHQLVGRRTGTTIDLIVDGAIVKSAMLGALTPTGYNSDNSSSSQIHLGAIFGGCGSGSFMGNLDSVRFFSRSLSLAELAGI